MSGISCHCTESEVYPLQPTSSQNMAWKQGKSLVLRNDLFFWIKRTMVWSWCFFPHLVLFLSFLKNFNWRIIALQCCVGFCNTIQQHESAISIHISPPSCTSPPSLPLHPTPLGCHRALGWTPCVIQQLPPAFYFTYVNVYAQCYSLNLSHPLLLLLYPQICSLSTCILFHSFIHKFFIEKKHLLKNSILELVEQ